MLPKKLTNNIYIKKKKNSQQHNFIRDYISYLFKIMTKLISLILYNDSWWGETSTFAFPQCLDGRRLNIEVMNSEQWITRDYIIAGKKAS